MPRGGVTNHIGVERKSSSFIGHTRYSASPCYPSTILPLLSPFLSFPISSSLRSSTIHLTFFSTNPLTAKHTFFPGHTSKDGRFLPVSCPVAVNNRKGSECLSLKNVSWLWVSSSNTTLLWDWEWMTSAKCGGLNLYICQLSDSYGAFYDSEAIWQFHTVSKSSVILISARAYCSASCWTRLRTGWCVG